jgi:hypothetical protein
MSSNSKSRIPTDESEFTIQTNALISDFSKFLFEEKGHVNYFFTQYDGDMKNARDAKNKFEIARERYSNNPKVPGYFENKEEAIKTYNQIAEKTKNKKKEGKKNILDLAQRIIQFNSSPKKQIEFLATLYNSSPVPGNGSSIEAMIKKNEVCKILNTASIVGLVLDTLVSTHGHLFTNSESNQLLIRSVEDSEDSLLDSSEYKRQMKLPAILAALSYNIGLYSPESQSFFSSHMYGKIENDDRIGLLKTVKEKTTRYLKKGLNFHELTGDVPEEFNITTFYDFLGNYTSSTHELGNIIKVAIQYSAFLFPKNLNPNSHNSGSVVAYLALQKGIEKNLFRTEIVQSLQSKIGLHNPGRVFELKDPRFTNPQNEYFMVAGFLENSKKPNVVKTSKFTRGGILKPSKGPSYDTSNLPLRTESVIDLRSTFGKAYHAKHIFNF